MTPTRGDKSGTYSNSVKGLKPGKGRPRGINGCSTAYYLPRDLIAGIKVMAKEKTISESSIVRQALTEFLSRHNAREEARQLMADEISAKNNM